MIFFSGICVYIVFIIKSLLKIKAVVCAVKFFVCTYIDCVGAINWRLLLIMIHEMEVAARIVNCGLSNKYEMDVIAPRLCLSM